MAAKTLMPIILIVILIIIAIPLASSMLYIVREGEQVVIPEGATVTTDTSGEGEFGPPGGMMMPMGGPPG